jgi:hypothetical protein
VFDTSGNLLINTSNGGIRFSNSSALTNSTLNDYEVGNWTVSPVRWTWTGSKTGTYVKVGRIVSLYYVVDATSISYTGSGSGWSIGGFPFTADGSFIGQLGECTAFNKTIYLDNIGYELFGRTSMNSTSGIGDGSAFNSSGRIKFTVTYVTSS